MLNLDNPHSERFNQLLDEVKGEIDALKAQIKELQNEKAQLEDELKKKKASEADVFSSVKETERMALKHQIKGLVSKIDERLKDQS